MLKRFIGKIWRLTPHGLRVFVIRASQKKFTVSVGAIILNEENKVLLLDHVLRPQSGWGIPGGFIEPYEQPIEGIRREILEETGIELENIEMQWVRTIRKHIEIIYLARGKGNAEVRTREIHSLGWFSVEEMPEKMSETQKRMVLKVFEDNKL